MNDKIGQLAETAGCAYWNGTELRNMAGCYDELMLFAELIINECIIVASRAECNDNELRCMSNVIANHFGIEE